MKLGKDEVLMVSYKCCGFSTRSAQGRIQGVAKIGHRGHFLQRTSSSDQKATAPNRMQSNDLEAYGMKWCYFLYARLVGTYYGMVMASGCPSDPPSVCGSVRKPCKHDTDWTVSARTVKLSTHATYDKKTNPIDFQGQGSKVKVTR